MSSLSRAMRQTLTGIILSLSATMIYAEVTAKDTVSVNPAGNGVDNSVRAQAGSPPQKLAPVWALHAEQWELARSGETILSLPALNQLINAWLADKQKKIEIQYPGGEDGELWVQELTDWLVSLGIPSRHVVTTPGSGADDVIRFNIVK